MMYVQKLQQNKPDLIPEIIALTIALIPALSNPERKKRKNKKKRALEAIDVIKQINQAVEDKTITSSQAMKIIGNLLSD